MLTPTTHAAPSVSSALFVQASVPSYATQYSQVCYLFLLLLATLPPCSRRRRRHQHQTLQVTPKQLWIIGFRKKASCQAVLVTQSQGMPSSLVLTPCLLNAAHMKLGSGPNTAWALALCLKTVMCSLASLLLLCAFAVCLSSSLPPTPNNSTGWPASCNNTAIGGNCTTNCSSGFTGKPYVVCQSNGQFAPTVNGSCVRIGKQSGRARGLVCGHQRVCHNTAVGVADCLCWCW